MPRPEYPRPQFERAAWINLNGTWNFDFDFGLSGKDRNLPKAEKLGKHRTEGNITYQTVGRAEKSMLRF